MFIRLTYVLPPLSCLYVPPTCAGNYINTFYLVFYFYIRTFSCIILEGRFKHYKYLFFFFKLFY